MAGVTEFLSTLYEDCSGLVIIRSIGPTSYCDRPDVDVCVVWGFVARDFGGGEVDIRLIFDSPERGGIVRIERHVPKSPDRICRK